MSLPVLKRTVLHYISEFKSNVKGAIALNRTMTIKGVGKLSLRPNYTVISMSLNTANIDYGKAMDEASEHMEALRRAIADIGFEKSDLKTTGFDVDTEYRNECDDKGNYTDVFEGYSVRHNLKLEFDFDNDLLAAVLNAVSDCIADPELNVKFTVKDREAVSAALLENACTNARAKAEILAKASGVTLGELLCINYDWGELHLYSPTRYALEDNAPMSMPCVAMMDIEPDDIDVSDNVTFVWEIK